MKVLIVEDEYYARKRLLKLVLEWDSSVTITGDVETGVEALNSIRREEPDIVLTDIRMPEMDGLQLSQKIMEHHPSVCVGILSGYADFEYAREAIRYHVKGYILKPIKKEELFKLLDELKEIVEKRNRERHEYNKALQNISSFHRVWSLTRLIYGQEALNEGLSQLFNLGQEPKGYWVIVLKSYGQLSERHGEMLSSSLKGDPHRDVFGFFNPVVKNEWIGICFRPSLTQGESFAGAMEDAVLRDLKAELNDRFSIGVSRMQTHAASLPTAYWEAKYVLAQHLCQGGGQLFEYAHLTDSRRYDWMEETENKLRKELMSGNVGSVTRIIDSLFDKLRKDNPTSVRQLHQLYSGIDSTIMKVMDERMIPVKPRKDIDEFASLEQLINELTRQVNRLCDGMANADQKEDENREFIDDLIEYVKENYACEISLDLLAKHRYYLNASYLSRLFKSRTGQGFSEFLTDCRMKKARELIEMNCFSISEIAGLVGYTKPSHFIQMFKKHHGQTPGSYKSHLQQDVKKLI